MKWSDTILLAEPLHNVTQLSVTPPQGWMEVLREREAEAYSRGRSDGERILTEQLLQQRAEIAELQSGILESLRKAAPQVEAETERALFELVLTATRKIVAGIPVDHTLVEAVVRDALRQTEETAEIVVQLHPEDLALLRRNEAPVLGGVVDKGPLRFTSAGEVSRGGCVIQTRFGLIDARREVKLEQLGQTLSA